MFACYLSDVQTVCEFLLYLLLFETHYESSTFVLLNFFRKEVKHTSMLHTTIHADDCEEC